MWNKIKELFKLGNWIDILFATIIFPVLVVGFFILNPWLALIFIIPSYAFLGFIILVALFLFSLALSILLRRFFRKIL